MVTITDVAKKKILEYMQAENEPGLFLRVGITGRGLGGFQYQLGFVKEEERSADDAVVDVGDFKVLIDSNSAPNLEGATIDFVQGLWGSGFKINNPNSIWSDPLAAEVQRVIDTQINPGIAAHGGYVILLEVKDNIAYIALGGGCHGCGMAHVTLKQGVEVMIKRAVPEIQQVIDTTDHAGGKNPYYQAAQGGQSPLA
ncbi:MAG: iron-sulfur cluster assembly accessory protein [candidate division KSB1 bacterium]|nr:iron-sulfur cluster assembly accessory protein [candidate division KSB1 bacterium]MDZ7303059.1 iron-sulfur cluster assembly accessory protein [candidate division KSB1 bacterium]MDZ7312433.1 iron-sulfur cluster assembly accessory protein [candidate division KSB1 bacterium]